MTRVANQIQGTARQVSGSDESLLACFAQVVAAHGHRTALVSDKGTTSYCELNAAANRAAHALLRRSNDAGDRIAILMPHGAQLIVAMLSVIKAGRVVVVLNATDPLARLKQLMEDAAPTVLLTDASYRNIAGEIAGMGCEVVCVDDFATNESNNDPDISVSPDKVAFLVYTSGSTGRPKAVMQTHRQIVQNAVKHSESMTLNADDRVTLLASLSGSQGVGTAWSTLLSGAALCSFPTMEKGVTGLASWIADRGITVYISSASLFRHFMQSLDDALVLPDVRVVRIASETATSADFELFQRHFSENGLFVHTLSSSETGNIAHLRLTGRDAVPDGRLPVGHPSSGMEVQILDERGREAHPGAIGKIAIRSRYLCAGYWRDEALTARRFSDGGHGLRVFCSGDLGRINADGLLEFIGRQDSQIKIRGFRVDVAEVETAILNLPEVKKVAVCAATRLGSDSQLVAFVVGSSQPTLESGSLRRALRPRLPDHMIPSRFVSVDKFPLTPHGKIDREKLMQNDVLRQQQGTDESPQTATEKLLADIWKEILNASDLGRHNDFFELGGDSLRAAVVAARIHDAIGINLNLGALIDHPTLFELAQFIDHAGSPDAQTATAPTARSFADRPLPLSFSQERIWKFCSDPHAARPDGYLNYYQILGPLDVEALRECLDFMSGRHEILRTTIALADGKPCQIVHPPAPVPLPVRDYSNAPDPARNALLALKQEASQPFDLNRGPLMRFSLARINENEHWLMRAYHPIINDGWSRKIYFDELAHLYEARVNGESPPLSRSAPIQYGAYAVWQRKVFDPASPTYREAAAWWKRFLAHAPDPPKLPFRRNFLKYMLARVRRSTKFPFKYFKYLARPIGADPEEGIIRWTVAPDVTQRLDDLAKQAGVTYFVLRLAVCVALLTAETNTRDIVIGTNMTNRKRLNTQNMLGHVTNLVLLRFQCAPEYKFNDWLSIVRKTMAEVSANNDFPYEELRKILGEGNVMPRKSYPIIQLSADCTIEHFGGLKLRHMAPVGYDMPWGFSMVFNERGDRAGGSICFDSALYDPVAVQVFLTRFNRLLEAISKQPDLQIGELFAIACRKT